MSRDRMARDRMAIDPDRLRVACAKRLLSQAELARRAGVCERTVHYVLARRPARRRTLHALASALRVDPATLLADGSTR